MTAAGHQNDENKLSLNLKLWVTKVSRGLMTHPHIEDFKRNPFVPLSAAMLISFHIR